MPDWLEIDGWLPSMDQVNKLSWQKKSWLICFCNLIYKTFKKVLTIQIFSISVLLLAYNERSHKNKY